MEHKPPSKINYRKIALLSSLGLMLPSSAVVGMLFGYLLDKLFKTQPWLLILFTLLGMASGVFNIIRGLNKFKDV
ncbi:MAG: AtpZ/AtpI family protein [Candidatus Aminicenantaceae bacterium]